MGYGRRFNRSNLYREVNFDRGEETEFPEGDMPSRGLARLHVGYMLRNVFAGDVALSNDPYAGIDADVVLAPR